MSVGMTDIAKDYETKANPRWPSISSFIPNFKKHKKTALIFRSEVSMLLDAGMNSATLRKISYMHIVTLNKPLLLHEGLTTLYDLSGEPVVCIC